MSFVMPSPSAIPAPLNVRRLGQRHSSPALKPITSKFSLSHQNNPNQSLSATVFPSAITRGNTGASTYSIPIGLGFESPRDLVSNQSSVEYLKTPCATPQSPDIPSPAALKPKYGHSNVKDVEVNSPSGQEQMVGPIGPSLASPTPSLHLLGEATMGSRIVGAKMVRIKDHAHSAPYPLPKPTPELLPYPLPESPAQAQSNQNQQLHSRALSEEKIPCTPFYDTHSAYYKHSPELKNHHSSSLPDLRPLQALTMSGTPITLEESRLSHTPSPRRTPNLQRASEALNQKWISELSKKDDFSEKWDDDMKKGYWGEELKSPTAEKEVVAPRPGEGMSPSTPPERWSGATMYENTQLRGMDGEIMSSIENEQVPAMPAIPAHVVSPQTPGAGLGLQYRHEPESAPIVSPTTPGAALSRSFSQRQSSAAVVISPQTPGVTLATQFPALPGGSPHIVSPRSPATGLRARFEQTTPFASPVIGVGSPGLDEVMSSSARSDEVDMRERLEESIFLHERQERETPNLPALTPLSEISLGSWGRESWVQR